jgi:Ca-activated chloride channel homolog
VKFSDPHWLVAGVLTCIALVVMWRRYDVRQRDALAVFVAAHLRQKLTGSVSRVGRLVQRSLFLVAVACLFGALAGPQLGFHWETISRRGNEVVFAIDTSRSMLTPDVKPDRLTRAKLAINDMARQLDGDGIGIVAFAGSAFLVCPLTLDHQAFQQSLDAIDVHTIPLGGTNIPSAIGAARAALSRRPGSDRILILVTDGENLAGDVAAAAKEAAQQDGLKIYTVGIGTAEGDLIPLPPDLGGGFVKDDKGALVKSHLDESGLNAIATATGGTYVNLSGQGERFEGFLRTVFAAVSKHDLVYRQRKVYTERYQWPLAGAVVLLLASLVVGTRRWGQRRVVRGATGARGTTRIATAGSVLMILGALVIPGRSHSADQTNPAGGTTDAKAPVVEYNGGTSAYRAGKFSQAEQAFQKSIAAAPASDAKRLSDQQDAYYNLGNTLYRQGQQLEKSDPQQALQKWNDAVRAYETALQLRGNDVDSRYNRDVVKRKIDGLRPPPPDQGGGGGGGGNGKGGGGGGGGGQPPPGQGQPPPQGKGKGSPPPPGQGQPPPQGGGNGAPPPPGQGQPPPQGGGSGAPPSQGQRPPAQGSGSGVPPAGQGSGQGRPPQDQGGGNDGAPSDNERAPGQMSADEARELLDSAKSDEHQSLLVPSGPRAPDTTPDAPFKNW